MPLRRVGIEADYYLLIAFRRFNRMCLRHWVSGQHQLIQPHCRLLLEAEQLLVPSMPTPACLRDFGRTLAAGLGVDRPVRFTRRIFISRRKTGTRTLANEAELEKLLHANRFETHFMEQYPLAKQARIIRESDVIVATHGAGLANLIFARPGTHVIEIMPAGRYNSTCYPEKSRSLRTAPSIIVCRACPSQADFACIAARRRGGAYRSPSTTSIDWPPRRLQLGFAIACVRRANKLTRLRRESMPPIRLPFARSRVAPQLSNLFIDQWNELGGKRMEEMVRFGTVVAGVHAVNWMSRSDRLVHPAADFFLDQRAGIGHQWKPFALRARGPQWIRVVGHEHNGRRAAQMIIGARAPVAAARARCTVP